MCACVCVCVRVRSGTMAKRFEVNTVKESSVTPVCVFVCVCVCVCVDE